MTRSLAVISSNIRYDEPTDDLHSWNNRRDFLASRLLEYSPDLLATQEGKHPQIKDVADRLSQLRCADSHREWIESLMYPCIFYNPDTLSLTESGDIWLSESPTVCGSCSFGSEFPRLCTWVRFAEGLLAINVHLDHANSETRLCQMRVLMQQLEPLKAVGDIVLLMGDFNESPECPVRQLVNTDWPELKDPWIELGNKEEPSHHHFYETIDYGSRVDWILASDGLQVNEMLLDKSKTDEGIYPSDHYILKAKFRWAEKE